MHEDAVVVAVGAVGGLPGFDPVAEGCCCCWAAKRLEATAAAEARLLASDVGDDGCFEAGQLVVVSVLVFVGVDGGVGKIPVARLWVNRRIRVG